MDRHEELLTAVDTLLAAHQVWQESDNPELSAELIARIEDALTVWSGGDMPGDLLDPYAKMRNLNETWTETVVQADDPEHIQTGKAGTFWKALDAIRRMRQRAEEEDLAETRPLESVAMLTQQKVPDQQICWIYRAQWAPAAKTGPGLWDQRKNRPRLDLLQKEREKPGSVIGEDFVPWYAAQRQAEATKRRMAADRAATAREERIAKMSKPCAESLAELVAQGVSLTQIAQMKKSTKAAIRKQCTAEGLPVPPEEYEAPRSEFSPDRNEAQERIDQAQRPMPAPRDQAAPADEPGPAEDLGDEEDYDTPETLGGEPEDPVTAEERLVAQWMDTGATAAGEIAKAIQGEGGPALKPAAVKAIMGRLKGDPDRLQKALA